jgi:hypothetical protein
MKELIFQNWIFIGTGIILALLGILIQKLKLYNLIAGYNTSSAKVKRETNIGQVAITMRNAFLVVGVFWIILPIFIDLFGLQTSIKALLLLIVSCGIIIWLVWTLNNNEKYRIK